MYKTNRVFKYLTFVSIVFKCTIFRVFFYDIFCPNELTTLIIEHDKTEITKKYDSL